jgi:hypothetical protein
VNDGHHGSDLSDRLGKGYLTAFFRRLITIPEIREDLVRVGRLPPTGPEEGVIY